MKTEYAKYHDGAVDLTGMFAWEEGTETTRPGILVVHAGTGLDDHAKNRAKRLAEWGYVAFACDMYGDGVAGDRDRVLSVLNELRHDPPNLCRRVSAGLDVLRSHPCVDGRIAAIGYCFGGFTVLELARGGANLAGVVSVHGTLSTSKPAPRDQIKAKILACCGALDPHVPMTQVSAFIDEMNESGADWQMAIYGGAKHGFAHENGPKLPGVEYHALADFRSSQLIHDFFRELFSPSECAA
jgi:dienelactone hydrolase